MRKSHKVPGGIFVVIHILLVYNDTKCSGAKNRLTLYIIYYCRCMVYLTFTILKTKCLKVLFLILSVLLHKRSLSNKLFYFSERSRRNVYSAYATNKDPIEEPQRSCSPVNKKETFGNLAGIIDSEDSSEE